MAVKLIIFDMEGVLINSKNMYLKSSEKVLEKLNIKSDREKIEKSMWMKAIDFYGKQIPENLPNREELIKKAIEIDDEIIKSNEFKNMVELIPTTFEGLKYLKEKNINMAIVTNSRRWIAERDLKKFKITNYITEIMTGSDDMPSKPNPDQLIELMKRFNSSKEETLYVGDSPNDIKTGKNAKVKTIGIYSGWYSKEDLEKEKPDYLIKDISEIKEVL